LCSVSVAAAGHFGSDWFLLGALEGAKAQEIVLDHTRLPKKGGRLPAALAS